MHGPDFAGPEPLAPEVVLRKIRRVGGHTMRSRNPLSDLPNLGPKSAAVLRRAGITDMGSLRVMGSVAAYASAKNIEPRVSLNLLWSLEGALTGLGWQQVAREHRTSLLLALEDHLQRQRK